MEDHTAVAPITAIPEVVLSSGHRMPLIGMGTMSIPLPPADTLTAILVEAIKLGYRHFDTAAIYGSEEPLGRAVAEALKQGLIRSREDVFITTKLWCNDAAPHLVLHGLKKSLRKLGLEYVDLYLIHWPVRLKEGTDAYNLPKENILPFDIKGTWEAMEECSRLGLARSIGTSNFGHKKLSQILQFCTTPPAVDQVEMHVAWRQEELREFCRGKGIHVTAWSPLSANGNSIWGSYSVMQSPTLKEIAGARGKSVAQIALRWVYQEGVSLIVKSFNAKRMKENLGILEWELRQDELEKIKEIPQNRGFSGDMWVYEHGPYKSTDEVWA